MSSFLSQLASDRGRRRDRLGMDGRTGDGDSGKILETTGT